jgi:hypothetical protein
MSTGVTRMAVARVAGNRLKRCRSMRDIKPLHSNGGWVRERDCAIAILERRADLVSHALGQPS